MVKKSKEEIERLKKKYPSFPSEYIPTTRKKKSPANELTTQIIAYIQSLGGSAFRQNSVGIYNPKTKSFRKSGQKRGTADVDCILFSAPIKIEVKIGRDTLSEYQKSYREAVIKSGGYYIVAKDLEQFKKDLQTILNEIRK